jgi:hypothetical protein
LRDEEGPVRFSKIGMATLLCAGCGGGEFTSGDDAGRGDAAGSDAAAGGDAEVDTQLDMSVAETEAGTCPCITDLSGVGTADFYVRFSVTTTGTVWLPIAQQRWICDATRPFWSVMVKAGGLIEFSVCAGTDGGTYDAIDSSSTVNDGQKHEVIAARVAGVFSVEVDGVVAQSQGQPVQNVGALHALEVGVDSVCGTQPLVGKIEGLCISLCRGGQ